MSACRFAVAWLETGADARQIRNQACPLRSFPEVATTKQWLVAAVMIGVDPHEGSHAAVATGAAVEPLGQLRVRACVAQAERLVAWAAAWPERTWAAGGLAAWVRRVALHG